MTFGRVVLGVVAIVVTLVVFTPASAHTRGALHLELEKSAPAADSTVTPPREIRLWFSEAAQANATGITLLRSGDEPLPLGDLVASEDRMIFHSPVPDTLANGIYTVSWRTMSADGHVVRGDYKFTVRAAH